MVIDTRDFGQSTEEQSYQRDFMHKNAVAGTLTFNTIGKPNPIFSAINKIYKKLTPEEKQKIEEEKQKEKDKEKAEK